MGFYELQAGEESLSSMRVTGKVFGGEKALAPHPWNMWGTTNLFATTKVVDLCYGVKNQSQRRRLAHQRMDLEEVIKT